MKQVERGNAMLVWALNNLGAELLCRHAPGRDLRRRYEDCDLPAAGSSPGKLSSVRD